MEDSAQPVIFKSKKRKAYRRKAEHEDGASEEAHEASHADKQQDQNGTNERSDDEVTLAATLRAIKKRSQAGSAGFGSHSKVAGAGEHDASKGQVVRQEGIGHRFTQSTGLVPDLNDKHMNAFIESRLALSRIQNQTDGESVEESSQKNESRREPQAASREQVGGRLSTTKGKLMEVDLGATEALKITDGQQQTQSETTIQKKSRLGPDGKPWRGRKNRRGSDDIARDKWVDEFLHENRLDVYEAPQATATAEGNEEDGDADERLAAEFRAEYMAEVAARKRQKKKPAAKPGQKTTEEVLKGPKLGGSRNVRSQVRDALLKETRDRK